MPSRPLPHAPKLLAAAAFALLGVVLPLTHATVAEAVESARPSYAMQIAPAFTLEGDKWSDRTTIDVYYTWAGGTCVLGGEDFSGPPSPTPPDVALAQLRASIDDINTRLRGALTLRIAGELTRAELCGQSKAQPIVVGWGTMQSKGEAGLAIYSTIQGAPKPAQIQFARVFIRSNQDFACPGGTDSYRDLRHFMTHELLHAIGVGHSSDPNAIMAPTSVLCEMPSTLQADDIAALAALYPPPPGPSGNDPGIVPVLTGTFTATPSFSVNGQALVVFTGGSIAQLDAAATQAQATGVWAQQANGAFRLYVIGGPAFVNDAFRTAFASGFAGATAVTLTR